MRLHLRLQSRSKQKTKVAKFISRSNVSDRHQCHWRPNCATERYTHSTSLPSRPATSPTARTCPADTVFAAADAALEDKATAVAGAPKTTPNSKNSQFEKTRQDIFAASSSGTPTPEIEPPVTSNTSKTSKMDYNYLYCLSYEAMPGVSRLGVSSQPPDQILKNLNCECCPHGYKIMFAKKVLRPMEKLELLRNLMSSDRTCSSRDFFRTPVEHIEALFDLMYGEPWVCGSN